MSTGEALLDQPLYIGVYNRQKDLYNGKPVYVKTGGGETLYAYYFVSEQHGVSLWVIGRDGRLGVDSIPFYSEMETGFLRG